MVRAHRSELWPAVGGPITVVFHTTSETQRLYAAAVPRVLLEGTASDPLELGGSLRVDEIPSDDDPGCGHLVMDTSVPMAFGGAL